VWPPAEYTRKVTIGSSFYERSRAGISRLQLISTNCNKLMSETVDLALSYAALNNMLRQSGLSVERRIFIAFVALELIACEQARHD